MHADFCLVALAIVRCRAGARSKQSCAAAHSDARYRAKPRMTRVRAIISWARLSFVTSKRSMSAAKRKSRPSASVLLGSRDPVFDHSRMSGRISGGRLGRLLLRDRRGNSAAPREPLLPQFELGKCQSPLRCVRDSASRLSRSGCRNAADFSISCVAEVTDGVPACCSRKNPVATRAELVGADCRPSPDGAERLWSAPALTARRDGGSGASGPC